MAEPSSQAEALINAICAVELDPLFWRSDLADVESAWYGHVPFAHWLVRALAPRCIVELGSHNGVSYAAFCRAAQREGLGTRCFAVDTWTGDEHAGFYGDEVFATLQAYHDQRFGAFSTLVRRSFDDALELLPQGSVDLLHIDGRHDYPSVRHDFDSWLGKMSPCGIVLLHDTNVHADGFGVWQLWAELQQEFPHFEFLHAHGLGVIAVGTECPLAIAALTGLSDHHKLGAVRERFAQLGERHVLRAQVNLLGRLTGEHNRQHEAVLTRLSEAETEVTLARSELTVARAALATTEQALLEAAREKRRQEASTSAADGPAHDAKAQRRAAGAAVFEQTMLYSNWPAANALRRLLRWVPAPARGRILLALRRSWRNWTPHLDHLRQPIGALPPPLPLDRSVVVSSPGGAAPLPAVWYVSGEPDTPGTNYRVRHYAAACHAAGADVTVVRVDAVAQHLAQAGRIDVLVIWRAPWTDALAALVAKARANGARVVFDVDDLMIDPALATIEVIDGIRSQNFNTAQVRSHYAFMQRTMLAADFCTAPTDELAGHMRRFSKTSLVLPNGFDTAHLTVARLAVRRRSVSKSDGILRLGYAGGSRTHQRDFSTVAAVLPQLLRNHPDCRLVLFHTGDVPLLDLEEFPGLAAVASQIEWRELVALEQLPLEIARFDINLAPLQLENPFCEAKSELKYFEAALAGVCTVASPVGPYGRIIRHGANGFLASTPAQWAAILTQLLHDPVQRQQVAQAALNDVLWTYGPDRRTQLMRRVLTEWQGGAAAADAFVLELPQRSGRPGGEGPVIPAGEVVFSVDHLGLAEVTVVVPLYNYANLVVATLESVRAQTLRQLDLVIVDDGSVDQSLATAVGWARHHAERFNRLVVIHNSQNVGLGLTRNAGFSAAETTYVLPLDADNLLRPGCCERLLAAIAQTGVAFAYPVIEEFGQRNGLIGAAPYDPSRFIGGNYIDAMALIAKSAWCAVGGYAPMRLGWEDYDFWCALAETGLRGFAVGGQPLADYRVHDRSLLALVTDMHDVKPTVISNIERRHSWVAVARPAERPASPASQAGRCSQAESAALDPGTYR